MLTTLQPMPQQMQLLHHSRRPTVHQQLMQQQALQWCMACPLLLLRQTRLQHPLSLLVHQQQRWTQHQQRMKQQRQCPCQPKQMQQRQHQQGHLGTPN